jgi:hypothetical protein
VSDPLLGWLDKAKTLCNDDPAFRQLGSCDARVGLKVGDAAYLVAFEAFECVSVQAVDPADLRDADFYLDMSRTAWLDLLARRRSGTSEGSLVSYDVTERGAAVRAVNPLNALKFERYHRTLQHFVDKVASLGPGMR